MRMKTGCAVVLRTAKKSAPFPGYPWDAHCFATFATGGGVMGLVIDANSTRRGPEFLAGGCDTTACAERFWRVDAILGVLRHGFVVLSTCDRERAVCAQRIELRGGSVLWRGAA